MSIFQVYTQRKLYILQTQWRWRFIAGNGKIIAVASEGYNNRKDCLDSIQLVKVGAPTATIKVQEP